MATTTKQDQNFVDEVVGNSLLEKAIQWIKENMEPEDVFDAKVLQEWAENAGAEFNNL
jgi:hypothetical protein